MAIQTVDQLKQWFETGDYPTQQQFWDWLDSFFHKTDTIPLNQVAGLVDALNGKQDNIGTGAVLLPAGQAYYDAPAGIIIEKIWCQINTPTDGVYAGSAAGANDIYQTEQADAAGNILLVGDRPMRIAQRIYLTGIKADTITLIYKR